ncbi:hypothetical protein BRC71_03130 [Halobacteriales archaeon QH_7_65_31]|nr:MAG: hypothetical protein BRC71_03130 [Halobacteriales archaeon QH_7_65_31]PSQ30353.1 MAG: hypothetical protein BRD16_07410 [Halobacteriales archaeon SW_6_65_46]
MGVLSNARENIGGVTTFLILGAGMIALIPGIPWFWAIWVLGFAVLLSLVGFLTDDEDETDESESDPEDPIERLKRRYADGELGDEEFERRLERLVRADDEEPGASIEREIERERDAR